VFQKINYKWQHLFFRFGFFFLFRFFSAMPHHAQLLWKKKGKNRRKNNVVNQTFGFQTWRKNKVYIYNIYPSLQNLEQNFHDPFFGVVKNSTSVLVARTLTKHSHALDKLLYLFSFQKSRSIRTYIRFPTILLPPLIII
jgi:hypothetical protein